MSKFTKVEFLQQEDMSSQYVSMKKDLSPEMPESSIDAKSNNSSIGSIAELNKFLLEHDGHIIGYAVDENGFAAGAYLEEKYAKEMRIPCNPACYAPWVCDIHTGLCVKQN